MTTKPKWTDRIFSPIRVLNHADGLHLEKFTDTDLDQIADCDDILTSTCAATARRSRSICHAWRTSRGFGV